MMVIIVSWTEVEKIFTDTCRTKVGRLPDVKGQGIDYNRKTFVKNPKSRTTFFTCKMTLKKIAGKLF